MSTAHRDVRWEACLGPEARFRRLDSEAVVFNPIRWETQLLTSLSAGVLDALRRSPATEEELAAEIAALLPVEASSVQILERVREILDELYRLGLVQPCTEVPDATR